MGWADPLFGSSSFPEGQLRDPSTAGWRVHGVIFALLWLPTALLVERYPTPVEWVTCSAAVLVTRSWCWVRAGGDRRVVVPARELLPRLVLLAIVGPPDPADRPREQEFDAGAFTPVLAVSRWSIVVRARGFGVRRVFPDSRIAAQRGLAELLSRFRDGAGFLAGLMRGVVRWRVAEAGSPLRCAPRSVPDASAGGVRRGVRDPSWRSSTRSLRTLGRCRGRPGGAPGRAMAAAVTDLACRRQRRGALIHDDALRGKQRLSTRSGRTQH